MIYLDNAATTKVSKDVLKVYIENIDRYFANPSSIHYLGMEANNKINLAKISILNYLKLNTNEYDVIFTSSATESNNLAIKGYASKNHNRGNTIVTSKIEHASVIEVFKHLENEYNFNVKYLSADDNGNFLKEELENYINKDTILVSLSPINNELGLKLNIDQVKAYINKFPKCVLHLDLAQTLGKDNFNYSKGDLLTLSSHKIHGLKSIACLIKKKKILLNSILYGGGQEFGLRSSTMDLPLILSFTEAIKETTLNYSKNLLKVKEIYDFLVNELSKIDEVILHNSSNQSPFILNFSLKSKKASVVVEALSNKEIYVSSVSACSSKKEEPSYVLLALNKSLKEASNSIRLSFSYENTLEEAKIFIKELSNILDTIRS